MVDRLLWKGLEEMTPPDRLLTVAELADYLNVHPGSIYRWRVERKGPRGIKFGDGSVRFRLSDVERWLDEQLEDARD